MKTFRIIALSLSIVLALAACNKEEHPTAHDATDDIVRIIPTIAPATRVAINEADGTGSFQSGDVIGVWATPQIPQTYDISRTATFDGTAWTYNTPLRWSDLPDNQVGFNDYYSITGHYPVQTATPDQYGCITFSVQTNQNTAEAYRKSDLLVSGRFELGLFLGVLTKKGEAVLLNFVHVMSRIKVTLTAGSNVTQEEVGNAVVKIKNAQISYNISLINGNTGNLDSPTYADITPLKSTTAAATFYALLPGQYKQSGKDWIEIEVTAGGEVATYELSAVTNLLYGYTLPVNLTLSRSGTKSDTRNITSYGDLILECTSVD